MKYRCLKPVKTSDDVIHQRGDVIDLTDQEARNCLSFGAVVADPEAQSTPATQTSVQPKAPEPTPTPQPQPKPEPAKPTTVQQSAPTSQPKPSQPTPTTSDSTTTPSKPSQPTTNSDSPSGSANTGSANS